MTEKERELIKAYLLNEDIRLDDEVRGIQQRLRYRRIDTVDAIEFALLLERYTSFKQFRKCIERLLSL